MTSKKLPSIRDLWVAPDLKILLRLVPVFVIPQIINPCGDGNASNSPKTNSGKVEKAAQRVSFGAGYPADVHADVTVDLRDKHFGQALEILEKNKHFGVDVYDPKARTSMTQGVSKKLRSEKLRAEFSFPRHLTNFQGSLVHTDVPLEQGTKIRDWRIRISLEIHMDQWLPSLSESSGLHLRSPWPATEWEKYRFRPHPETRKKVAEE